MHESHLFTRFHTFLFRNPPQISGNSRLRVSHYRPPNLYRAQARCPGSRPPPPSSARRLPSTATGSSAASPAATPRRVQRTLTLTLITLTLALTLTLTLTRSISLWWRCPGACSRAATTRRLSRRSPIPDILLFRATQQSASDEHLRRPASLAPSRPRTLAPSRPRAAAHVQISEAIALLLPNMLESERRPVIALGITQTFLWRAVLHARNYFHTISHVLIPKSSANVRGNASFCRSQIVFPPSPNRAQRGAVRRLRSGRSIASGGNTLRPRRLQRGARRPR